MTIEEIRELTAEQVDTRKAEIATELEAEGADLEALSAEVDALNERKAAIVQEMETRNALAEKIASGSEKVTIKEERKEETKMSDKEIRNSREYIHAFAEYIKTGNDEECRALLTENVSSTVPVPELVDDVIRTAWDNEPILSRVRKTNVKGNLKVGFERSADAAVVHTEGGDAVTEESLTLGIVTMVPSTIKKWISVSDEVLDMDDGAFLTYVYNEISYQIMKKLSALVVGAIIDAPATSTASAAAVPTSAATAAATASIITAEGELCDEATNLVVICDKATAAALKAAALSANYGYDPFDGLEVLTSSAASGHILVGDLNGVQVNFPNGEAPSFRYDENTLATQDLVRIIGRLPAAYAVTAPNWFVDVTLESASA